MIVVEKIKMEKSKSKTLRLVLGDQLNSNHSWFSSVDNSVTYVLMEVRTETDYARHHIQKLVGFFAAMRNFAKQLVSQNHRVIYIQIQDSSNLQSFEDNIKQLIATEKFDHFEYQYPDEYRLDEILKKLTSSITISSLAVDTEHFFTTRNELANYFKGKKIYLMESFYRAMRKKHDILMEGDIPVNGKWNFDEDNRKKLPKNHKASAPFLFENNVSDIVDSIQKTNINTIGNIDPTNFIWPINREQSLTLLDFFVQECLPLFGTYQDALMPKEWSLYHSRLSFSLNTKMLSPKEVINKAISTWLNNPDTIQYNQLEGFVRQILGWREYIRGIYWQEMPEYNNLNYFQNQEQLPDWYWTGATKMHCLQDAIQQSLKYSYAHHIQRLMITGNFALLAGVHPDQVDAWYLGIYIDAIEWVEKPNTRGMSQFADGGIVGTKPYVSSAAYIDKMSHHCESCFYDKKSKVGAKACPFNSLYWHFFDKNEDKLVKNPRVSMMYSVWRKMKPSDKEALLLQANNYLKKINEL